MVEQQGQQAIALPGQVTNISAVSSDAKSGSTEASKSKVAEAIAQIEDQVRKQQQEEKDLKQKDGTPVRRSKRVTKGVRTSLG
jgi:hypothetical protein